MSATPTLESLAEDIADLRADRDGFAAELEMQKGLLDQLREDAPDPNDGDDSEGEPAGKPGAKGSGGKGKPAEAPPVPPFILLLEGEAYARELGALAHWVARVLVPVYGREPGSAAPWCPSWWEHSEAVARLHAVWLAWQELTTPETGGRLGPGTWHRDFLRPALDELRDSSGPFAACMVTPNKGQHRVLKPPLLNECPFPPPAPAPVADPAEGGSGG